MPSQQVQERNPQMVRVLATDFQLRYESSYAWKTAIGALLDLPALRGAWPMSAVGYSNVDRARDISGNGNHLSSGENNIVTFGYRNTLIPVAEFVAASTQYLNRADGGAANWADITTSETYIITTQRGITLGGWFYVDSDTGADQTLMGKLFNTGSGVDRSYQLYFMTIGLGTPAFGVSTGAMNWSVSGGAATTGLAALDTWNFYCGRLLATGPQTIFLNNRSTTNAFPAHAINDTAADFTIGATGIPSLYLDGKASLCFLSACAMTDAEILAFYEHTRALFGV